MGYWVGPHKKQLSAQSQETVILNQPYPKEVLPGPEERRHLSTSFYLPLARPWWWVCPLSGEEHQKEETHWRECMLSPNPFFFCPIRCWLLPLHALLCCFCMGNEGLLLYLTPYLFVWSNSSSFFLFIFLYWVVLFLLLLIFRSYLHILDKSFQLFLF